MEMSEAVGMDNIFIFGLNSRQVTDLWGRGYNSTDFYFKQPKLRIIIDELNNGFGGETFENISNYLLRSNQVADPYMCMADFGAYCDIHQKALEQYKDKMKWAKMSLNNIAAAGRFSADRSVREYAQNIWGLKQIR